MTATGAYRIADATPDHLMITVPGTSLGSSWISVILIAFFLVLAYTTSRSVARVYRAEKTALELRAYVWRYRIIVVGIGLAGLGAFWLLGYSSGSIELDRGVNRVTMHSKRTAFLPARTRSLPLSVIERATVDIKPNSARIRLSLAKTATSVIPCGAIGQARRRRLKLSIIFCIRIAPGK